ncbi:relaxase [Kribbella capetownensis]|uniref:Relaxase n=1 Tax=Kribbella capetownensis TaxID=1572659 RepID=A0A4R0IYI7_9ACTN|nr:relaxase [Kribbella capetownensis]TCC33905.1 relaxase [Kribbella capetownensis]
MPNIVKGGRMAGLLVYLCGPGRANEHTEPHLVGGDGFLQSWYDDAELHRDSALAIAGYLDKPRRLYGVEVTAPARDDSGQVVARKPAHVWHCSLALEPGEGPLGDGQWQAIAADFMDAMGFTELGSGKAPARWAAIHHGLTTAGGDHIHIAASLVREDGTKVSTHMDQPRAQRVCNDLERKYGLRVLASRETGAGMPGVKPAEQQRAARLGLPEPERLTIARTVRACAAASATEAEFVRACRHEGLLLRARFADGRGDVVVGYSVALKPVRGERPLYYRGSGLAKDLALPRLRELWPSTPELAAEAVAEWTAAKRGRRTPGGTSRPRTSMPAGTWEEQANEVAELREQLRSVPLDDRHSWAVVARQAAGVFAAWSRRTEHTPGPLAATADALARSAQMRYRQPRPKHTQPAALTGTAMLLMHASKTGPAADLVLLRQLANTLKAVHDAHVARGELKQALVLESTVRGQLAQILQTTPAAVPMPAASPANDTAQTAAPEDKTAPVQQTGQPSQAPGQSAATAAVSAAIGPEDAATWRNDPAWPALEQRIVELAGQGLDPVGTLRQAHAMRSLDTAESAVQVMTWRIDKLVHTGDAPAASTAADPDLAAALEALGAASGQAPQQAVTSPLPNPLPAPATTGPAGARTRPSTTPAASSSADSEIGD